MEKNYYNNQPENCPEPQGKCPVYSPDFITKLHDLEEQRKYYKGAIKEILVVQEKHEKEMGELRCMFKDVIGALNGVMGRSGLVAEHTAQESRIHNLEKWKNNMKSFVAGALAVCSVVSAGLTLSLKYLIDTWKH